MALTLVACTGGGDPLDVSLGHGAGLAEGTPVQVMGVKVGAVGVDLVTGQPTMAP